MNTTLYQKRPKDSQNWTNLYLEPHDYRIYYVNIDCVISMEFLPLSRRRSSARNVPSGEERGETDVFAGYIMSSTNNANVIERVLNNKTIFN